MQRLIVVVALTSIVGPAQSNREQGTHPVGNMVSVCGTLVRFQCKRSEESLLTLRESSTNAELTVSISPAVRTKFGRLFESRHVFSDVCATGVVNRHNDAQVMTLTEPDQLRVERAPSSVFTYPEETMSACDDGVELPKLVREVKPQYPREARARRIQGDVLLETVVLSTGRVGRIRVLRSVDPHFGLDEAAARALRQWRFSPGSYQGHPVPVVVTVAIAFRLRD